MDAIKKYIEENNKKIDGKLSNGIIYFEEEYVNWLYKIIEQMKCCNNCKYHSYSNLRSVGECNHNNLFDCNSKYSLWELKESD